MYYIGIDPGNIESAYCIIDESENILEFGKIDNEKMLDKITVLINQEINLSVAIESIQSYGFKVGQSVFDTCFWYGRFYERFFLSNKAVQTIGRKAVITALTNNPNGNDKLIRETMILRYGKHGTIKNKGKTYGISKDVWSALAIATWLKDKEEFEKFYNFKMKTKLKNT